MSISSGSKRNIHRKQEVREFYEEAQRWQSELDFWKVELVFFKRLLDIYGLKITDRKDKLIVADLQEKIDFFIHEEIADYKREIGSHVNFLKDLSENKIKIEDTAYEDKHQQNIRLIASCKREFFKLKNELYTYTEKLKQ